MSNGAVPERESPNRNSMMKRDPYAMTRLTRFPLIALVLASTLLVSCRGQLTDNEPVHLQRNMMFQERFEAQERNPFFENEMAMREPVDGTIARGYLREDTELYEGVDDDGNFVEESPVGISEELLRRGQDRYDIYCAVCHGGTGDGQGIIMTGQFGYVPAPTIHQDRIREMPDGELYSIIKNGIRNMPAYAHQVKTEDRWAIVSYLRALQLSQNASARDVMQMGEDPRELLDDALVAEEQAAAEEAEQEAASGGADDEGSDGDDGETNGDDSAEGDPALGEQLFGGQGCQACHSVDGSAGVGPSMAGLYGSERELASGESVTADEEYLHRAIVEPGAEIAEGYQNMMTPYGHLDESEILSLIEYIKTLAD
ncbi:MAG: c-type cytochrome [Bacteroidota bacterium]